TKEKQKVAVKILRPGIEEAFTRDISFFRWIAENSENRMPWLKRLKLPAVVETFAEWTKTELDLRLEAAAAAELKENMKHNGNILVPQVDWQRTTRRVLTMERIEGVRIDDIEALASAGHDVEMIMKK